MRVEQDRNRLLAIRDVRMDWEDVDEWQLELPKRFGVAFGRTNLPDRTGRGTANAFLVKARRSLAR